MIRAASWLREGRRPAEAEEDLSAFERSGRSGLGCEAVDVFAFMARSNGMAAAHKGQPLHCCEHHRAIILLNSIWLALARFFVLYRYNSSTVLHHVYDGFLSY